GGPPRLAVVALNDAIADGRDVSWIWDVDFEPLLDRLGTLVATGSRAAEVALRFRYAGFPRERIEVVPDLGGALARACAPAERGGEFARLRPYRAMLAWRRLTGAPGQVRPYGGGGA